MSATLTIRLFKILANNLYTVNNNTIPLYCRGSLGSSIEVFGIGFIIPVFHIVGSVFHKKIFWNKIRNVSIVVLFFRISFGKLSSPTDLLFLASLITCLISDSKISCFNHSELSKFAVIAEVHLQLKYRNHYQIHPPQVESGYNFSNSDLHLFITSSNYVIPWLFG